MITIPHVGFLVCGSRSVGGYRVEPGKFSDYKHYYNREQVQRFCACMEKIVSRICKIEEIERDLIMIISGRAVGPDDLAYQWACKNSMNCMEMPAQWNKYGKSAGYMRNHYMVSISKYVFAAYDGKSKGTAHTIKCAKTNNTRIKTVIFD